MAQPVLTIKFGPATYGRPEDVQGVLLDHEGEALWSHHSSSRTWLENDLTKATRRAEVLRERYPDGYNLVWAEARPGGES